MNPHISNTTVATVATGAFTKAVGVYAHEGARYCCQRCRRWFRKTDASCTLYHFSNECCHCLEREVAPECDAFGRAYDFAEPDPIIAPTLDPDFTPAKRS